MLRAAEMMRRGLLWRGWGRITFSGKTFKLRSFTVDGTWRRVERLTIQVRDPTVRCQFDDNETGAIDLACAVRCGYHVSRQCEHPFLSGKSLSRGGLRDS